MIPFSTLIGVNRTTGTKIIEVSQEALFSILKPLIERIEVDETWYRKQYADVDEAITDGYFESAAEHYKQNGYYEDRMPRNIMVDEKWYLDTYKDVADAVKAGRLYSASQHFLSTGFKEGRLPSPGWSLTAKA